MTHVIRALCLTSLLGCYYRLLLTVAAPIQCNCTEEQLRVCRLRHTLAAPPNTAGNKCVFTEYAVPDLLTVGASALATFAFAYQNSKHKPTLGFKHLNSLA